MVKAIKNKKIVLVFFKMIAFIVLLYFLYQTLKKVDWNFHSNPIKNYFWFVLAFSLIPLNWFFEWKKWQETLRFTSLETTDQRAFQSFCAGIITGMLTPNMQGNFIGRIYYFERKNRIDLIGSTLISNYGQFLMSLLFGVLGLVFLQETPLRQGFYLVLFIFLIALLLFLLAFFSVEHFSRFFRNKKGLRSYFLKLKSKPSFRWRILYFSFLRYLVFVVQFCTLLLAFGVPFSIELIAWIFQVYLWVTISPSLFLGKLAIRESISLWVLSFAGLAQQSILLASLSVWVFNLFIPTIFAIFISKKK